MSCLPLNIPPENKAPVNNAGEPVIKTILLTTETKKEIQFLKGELSNHILQLPELIEGKFYSINLVALNYDSNEILYPADKDETGFTLKYSLKDNDSDIPYFTENYSDDENHRCIYIAFKAYNQTRAYLSLKYLFNNNYRNSNIIIQAGLSIVTLNYPEQDLPGILEISRPYTGFFTEKKDNSSVSFNFQTLDENTWYKARIEADFSNSIFPNCLNLNFRSSLNINSDAIEFQNSYTSLYYFKVNHSTPSLHIKGDIGTRYTILMSEASYSFVTDSYEPDDGPLSSNIDSISGTDIQSASHTLIKQYESDWIQFTPTESGYYSLDFIIEDSFTEADLDLIDTPYIDIKIIHPNGSTIIKQAMAKPDQKWIMPVNMTNILSWNISAENLSSPWFIHLLNSSYGNNPIPIEYSIRIHLESSPY
ncbi:MAG: hypothetical protein JXR70_02495 [Spirochaetales bacterium]|nr:hypothetical protein [Spirochaetales bacterium]